jgi:hypothetical protein
MSAPSTPTSEADTERAFGLLLFEAEESLARGHAEKALVLASRAVRERPESLIARSLFDRTRREMTRGKRRERLEARVTEARGLVERGEFPSAEKIVATVLKLIPDHPAALDLFALLKERRLAGGTAEAEAERELGAMMQARARRAAEQARAAIAAGWSFRALMTVRRALALVPDDAELLGLYAQSLREVDRLAGQRAIRRAAHARILAAQGRMSAGEAAEAARILKGVLKEDPGNPEAREALKTMEDVAAIAPARVADQPSAIAGRFTHRKPAAPGPVVTPARPAAPASARRPAVRATPGTAALWAIGAATVAIGAVAASLVGGRGDSAPAGTPRAAALPAPAAVAPPVTAAPASPEIETLRIAVPVADPVLGQAIADALASYGRSLEAMDARLLAEARPDLGPHDRQKVLARYAGAENVATDLRVQSVVRRGDRATVSVIRTDVIAGRPEPTPPVTETLRFRRERGAWVLRPAP